MPDVNLHGPPYKQVPTVTAVNVLHMLTAFHKLSQCSLMSRMLYKDFLVTVQVYVAVVCVCLPARSMTWIGTTTAIRGPVP